MSAQNSSNQKVQLLEQIFSELKDQASKTGQPTSKILKIKGADTIVLQLNAVPNGSNIRFSMTLHRAGNFKKQIGIVSDDAESLEAIVRFLKTFKPVLDKYVRFSKSSSRSSSVVEIDVGESGEEEEEGKEKEEKKTAQKRNRNIEEEF